MGFSAKTIDVLGIGSALMDIQVTINDEVLSQLGLPKGGMVLCDAKRREDLLGRLASFKKVQSSGGSVANSLAAVAKLGGKAAMFGCVAEDTIGQAYVQDMEKAGVDFLSKRAQEGSGTCIVLITPDSQRTLATTLGCAPMISKEQIEKQIIARANIFYIEGYLWDRPETISVVKGAMAMAKKYNTQIAFSSNDSFCIERHKEDFLSLLTDGADIYFANAQEAKALSGESDLSRALDTLNKLKGDRFLIVTNGEHGSYLMHRRDKVYVEAPKTVAVDSTGAGDAYAAGILYGWARGMPLAEMGKIAADISAQVVARLGARY